MSFAAQLPPNGLQTLTNLFVMFDVDKSNTLSYAEFAALLAHAGYHFQPHELIHLQFICDSTKTGHIRLNDWLEAGAYMMLSEAVFHSVDADKSGSIEPLELGHALMMQGYKWDSNQIQFFFNKFNTTRNGRMTITEWLKLSIFVLSCKNLFNTADIGAKHLEFDVSQSAAKVGSLAFLQFWPLLSQLGVNADQAQAANIFNQVDTDKSGTIEQAEFIYMMAQLP